MTAGLCYTDGCQMSPYSEKGHSDLLLIRGGYLIKEGIKNDFKREKNSDHERVCKK